MSTTSENMKQEPEADFILILPAKQKNIKLKIKEEKDIENTFDAKFEKLKNGKYQCSLCRIVVTYSHAVRHRRSHKNKVFQPIEKPLKRKCECDVCGKLFKEKYEVVKHLFSHFKPKICKICDKRFATNRHLKNHLATTHERTGAFQCNYCVKNFNTKIHLEAHIKNCHEYDKTIMKCSNCSFTSNPKEVRKHRAKIHLGRFCKTCDKTFVSLRDFENHLFFHKNSENLTCKVCGSSFETARGMSHHLRFHQELKSKFHFFYSKI
jgi:hypothetical protein